MLQKVISYSFYLLFFLTPLIWTSINYELFEYNKMIFVYGITVIIVGSWLLKIINQKSFIFNRTLLDIPLLLFLTANILSTIFSIDPHTSIWGYYSRSNGGLLSVISYLLLYWAFVSNIEKDKIFNYLKAAIFSGVFISIWAILEHFGVSFSCVILRGEFNANCWIQDVQARVFATLGQPNWLAAYLAMLIFPAIYFLLTASNKLQRITYFLLLITLYLAFTFTYSRGPSLGFLAGLLVFVGVYFVLPLLIAVFKITISQIFLKKSNVRPKSILKSSFQQIAINSETILRPLILVVASFLIINVLFGSALTSFRLVSKFAAPVRPSISMPTTPSGTQLENGGTESGQIRLIVWRGALDIFKHYPIFGTGVETFAYSYYQFRPVAHNLTSEWDFLYNKAHNEFLNYLATTGIVGLGSYSIIIITFIIVILKKYKHEKSLLLFSLLAAYISFLVQAFFLFSVVITNLFFFLFPALTFVASKSFKPVTYNLFPVTLLFRRSIYTNIARGFIIFFTVFLLYSVSQLWFADTLFSLGEKNSDAGNPGRAYNLLSEASDINPHEPFYKSELGFAAASAATALEETDATLSARLVKDALMETDSALTQSPKNVSFWRSAIRTYFELSTIDKKYTQTTLDAVNKSIGLAPTDPKLYLTQATILQSIGRKYDAIKSLEYALKLKLNYLEAKAALEKLR